MRVLTAAGIWGHTGRSKAGGEWGITGTTGSVRGSGGGCKHILAATAPSSEVQKASRSGMACFLEDCCQECQMRIRRSRWLLRTIYEIAGKYMMSMGAWKASDEEAFKPTKSRDADAGKG